MVVSALATIGTILFANSHSVLAAENQSANTLKVSPVRSDVEIKAGTSKVVETIVTNLTDAPIKVHAVENDFVSGDERGTPALILDENKYAPTHSLKRFMKPLTDVTIAAHESATVKVEIAVPQNAQAGGYFGAVRFAPASPDGGGQVNLSASVASLILLRVPGDIVEKLDLTDFSVQRDGVSGTYFSKPDKLQVTARFANKGNVQVGPFGKISVKNGDKVVYAVDFNNKTPRDMILPDGARRWDIPLKKIEKFGHYTVSATFTYGVKNQTVEVTKSFWVIPTLYAIVAVIILLLVIVLIAFGIWLIVRAQKRRKQHTVSGRGRSNR